MNPIELDAAVEAVVFACGSPVSADRLCETLGVGRTELRESVARLTAQYEDASRGISLIELDGCYQFCTKAYLAAYVKRALELRKTPPLSKASLEVLAIVAYNQPVTRAFIEQVRGVDCGAVVQGLVQKSLIEEKGRLELPGRPLLYGTTADFLRSFGLNSLEGLPPLPQKEEENAAMEETTLDDVIEQTETVED